MEAIETVMSKKEWLEIWYSGDDEKFLKIYNDYLSGLIKQASISFKAGQDSRLREVEEWMDKNCLGCRSNTPCNTDEYLGFHKESWQAFLKGLEGDK